MLTPMSMSSCKAPAGPDITRLAFLLAEAVAGLVARVRAFCHEVMLAGHACPTCGGGLVMVRDGACRCLACGRTFDPTVAFQTCDACGGRPRLRVRRYECRRCQAEIVSRFLFDGLVFDAAYFREKMAEHRKHRQAQRERVRQMLAACRSSAAEVDPAGVGWLARLAVLAAGSCFCARPRFAFRLCRGAAGQVADEGSRRPREAGPGPGKADDTVVDGTLAGNPSRAYFWSCFSSVLAWMPSRASGSSFTALPSS